jgi:CRP-like cAMP-binding protein
MNVDDDTRSGTDPKGVGATTQPLAALIVELPLLKGLSSNHLQTLADNAMQSQFKDGELIFREGDPANRFYLIQSGRVAVESSLKDGHAVRLQTLGAGEVLGWSWLFPPYYWHFDARALAPISAIFFYGTRLREECEKDHDLGYELMKRVAGVVVQRLQATRRQLLQSHELPASPDAGAVTDRSPSRRPPEQRRLKPETTENQSTTKDQASGKHRPSDPP